MYKHKIILLKRVKKMVLNVFFPKLCFNLLYPCHINLFSWKNCRNLQKPFKKG